jgi:hypothetical protein
MSTQHTPLPWQISDARTVEGTFMIVGGEGFGFGLIADVTTAEDAALIFKVVNSHDALVRALEEIDAVAVSKKAGSLVRMQRIARKALAGAAACSKWEAV